jgi:hypothetical protein
MLRADRFPASKLGGDIVPINNAKGKDELRKRDAMLSYHFKIPHPEQLTDEVYYEKWEQLSWVLAKNNTT